MKKNSSTINRLFPKIFSIALLLSISLTPVMNPIAASANGATGGQNTTFAPMMVDTTTTVTNPAAVPIPDSQLASVFTTITIAGAVGTITNVTMTLNNLTIARPRDLDILLVSPSGQKFIVVSDTGGTTAGSATANVTITLSDAAATVLPNGTQVPLTSGTFRPTDDDVAGGEEASLAAPAPAGPYFEPAPAGTDTFHTVFAQPGVLPNGIWTLYIQDDAGGGTAGTLAGGWTLNVTTNNIPVTAANANVSGRVVNSEGRAVSNVKVGMTLPSGEARYALTNPFGYYNFANVPAGETYVFAVKAKGYQPASVVREVNEDVADLVITLQPDN
jgi:subtilisin-like proprotein convertase family protein